MVGIMMSLFSSEDYINPYKRVCTLPHMGTKEFTDGTVLSILRKRDYPELFVRV